MFWLVLLVVIVALLFYYNGKSLDNWKARKVVCLKSWPIMGAMGPFVFGQQSLAELVEGFYRKISNKRYIAFLQFLKPTLVLNDVDLIKQITIKDFNYFTDRRIFVTEKIDPLFGKSLFSLTGQKWKSMRSTLSPAFSSSKMKTMFTLISDMAEQFTDHLSKRTYSNNIVSLEMKDLFTRFANDVIATSAFGINCDSIQDRNNEFYKMGQKTILDGFSDSIKIFGYTLSPTIMEFLSIRLFDEKVTAFFRDIVVNTIKIREEKRIVRPDMIHLLMEARKGNSELSNEDIASQAIFFFFAGFETTSTLLCHLANELAQNIEVQERLQKEIDETIKKHGKKVSYEGLMDMKYLDMVVNETLRKWPTVPVIDRKCIQEYVIPATGDDEEDLVIQKDDNIWIPIYGVHRDPKYFPNPDKFDPERFSAENIENIKSHSYLPFGIGPRNCIGARFALMEAKILYFYILSQFNIMVVEKTQMPFRHKKHQFNIHAENGFWVGFKLRKK